MIILYTTVYMWYVPDEMMEFCSQEIKNLKKYVKSSGYRLCSIRRDKRNQNKLSRDERDYSKHWASFDKPNVIEAVLLKTKYRLEELKHLL